MRGGLSEKRVACVGRALGTARAQHVNIEKRVLGSISDDLIL